MIHTCGRWRVGCGPRAQPGAHETESHAITARSPRVWLAPEERPTLNVVGSRQSVANHEASHAVVYWIWGRLHPDSDDPGETLEVTIEPTDDGQSLGLWKPLEPGPPRNFEELRHTAAGGIAGPVSDEIRREYRASTSDVMTALRMLENEGPLLYEGAVPFSPAVHYQEIRGEVHEILMSEHARGLVEAVSVDLLIAGTLNTAAVQAILTAGD